jgi:hypothetical protein
MAVDGYLLVGDKLAGVERMRRFDDESAAMSAGSSLSRMLTLCNHRIKPILIDLCWVCQNFLRTSFLGVYGR